MVMERMKDGRRKVYDPAIDIDDEVSLSFVVEQNTCEVEEPLLIISYDAITENRSAKSGVSIVALSFNSLWPSSDYIRSMVNVYTVVVISLSRPRASPPVLSASTCRKTIPFRFNVS
jgi:hypothetical protein